MRSTNQCAILAAVSVVSLHDCGRNPDFLDDPIALVLLGDALDVADYMVVVWLHEEPRREGAHGLVLHVGQ